MSAEQSLADEFYRLDRQASSHFDNSVRKFWPESTFSALIKRDAVRTTLANGGEQCGEDLLDFIIDRAKKVFTVALMVNDRADWLIAAMRMFQAADFDDSSLGQSIEIANGHSSTVTPLDRLFATYDPSELIWKARAKHFFSRDQWQVLVPIFSSSKTNYDFGQEAILPFTSMKPNHKRGAFSRVYKATIHKDHYQDPENPDRECPDYFAIKEIIPPDQEQHEKVAETWGQEARTLKQMNERDKTHIIQFITAFTRGSSERGTSYYLMFEWADGGSLEDLWLRYPMPNLSENLIREVVTQLCGLAQGLNATHYQEDDVGTRHGDLKPENIFQFSGTKDSLLGTLKIGDWGLAKYHNMATHRRIHATTTNWGTTLYEAPEFVVPVNGKRIMGRQYDIWSFGCVLLEFLIWLMYGQPEIERFRKVLQERSLGSATCYKTVNKGGELHAVVHEVVVAWMAHLAEDPSCAADTALGELLKLVKQQLLVVDMPPMRAATVYLPDWDLPEIKGLVEQSPQIAVTPTPRSSNSDAPKGGLAQLSRANAKELLKSLQDILDDEDRPEDYWFREPAEGYRRRPPLEPMAKAMQDASGHLAIAGLPAAGQIQVGGAGQPSKQKGLAVEEPKFVSELDVMSGLHI